MKFKPKIYIILVLAIAVASSGFYIGITRENRYNTAATQFNKLYFETAECINLPDPLGDIVNLQSESNSKNIEKMGVLLKTIERYIPKKKEKLLRSFKDRYNGLVFLRKESFRFNELNIDDKSKIYNITDIMILMKDNWKNDPQSIWQ